MDGYSLLVEINLVYSTFYFDLVEDDSKMIWFYTLDINILMSYYNN